MKNTAYRRVISTSRQMQLVLMSLKPGVEIGIEQHPRITQFIRVESGYGIAILSNPDYGLDNTTIELQSGVAVFIPAGTWHNVINTSNDYDLKVYTIYAPPQHPEGLVEEEKEKEEE